MLKLQTADREYLRIIVDGQLSPKDYDGFVAAFEGELATRFGRVPMLIELGPDFGGWTPAGVLRDLKFDARHADRFGRIAVVGNQRWEKWGTKVSDPFFEAEMRFFESRDLPAAEAWLRDAAQGARP